MAESGESSSPEAVEKAAENAQEALQTGAVSEIAVLPEDVP
jgi:hypothetical protein